MHYEEGRLNEAEACFRASLNIQSGQPDVHANLGLLLWRAGRLREASDHLQRGLALRPDDPLRHMTHAMLRLARGDMAAGWAEYEWRWKMDVLARTRRDMGRPQWDGKPAPGQTLFIQPEGGFGDIIQFSRYVSLAAARGMKVILEAPPPLVRLLRGLPGGIQVIKQGDELPDFDLYCPLLSLPLAFGTTLDSIPGTTPYLFADQYPISRATTHRRVGLVWAGNPGLSPTGAAGFDKRRSIPPERFAPLFSVTGVTFFSLQKFGTMAPADFHLKNLMPDMTDFADTASLIQSLDLVVAVDTAVAHLAGALNKPVWLLNRFDSCWRWLTGRRDSPWYPSMRIYRQPEPGDWESVIAEVARDLKVWT